MLKIKEQDPNYENLLKKKNQSETTTFFT